MTARKRPEGVGAPRGGFTRGRWRQPVAVTLPDGTTWTEGAGGTPWVTFGGVPGWEAWQVSVLADHVDGAPRAVGIRLEPADPQAGEPLTQTALRALPLAFLVDAALAARGFDMRAAQRAMAQAAKVKPPQGSKQATTAEAVAVIYRETQASPKPGLHPRQEAARRLGISTRTVDKYVAQARRQGLLPAYRKSRSL